MAIYKSTYHGPLPLEAGYSIVFDEQVTLTTLAGSDADNVANGRLVLVSGTPPPAPPSYSRVVLASPGGGLSTENNPTTPIDFAGAVPAASTTVAGKTTLGASGGAATHDALTALAGSVELTAGLDTTGHGASKAALDAEVTARTSAVALKAPLASPALTGTPTAPTASAGTNTTQIATTAHVKAAIDNLINGAPGALDTLKEISDQLAADESAASALTTLVTANTTAIGTKLAKGAIRWLEDDYGCDPTGVTDATAAINTALVASAAGGFTLKARSSSIFKVSSVGTKSFVNPSGGAVTGKNYAVEVPHQASADFGGAMLRCTAGADLVVLSNKTTQATATGTATLDGITTTLTSVTGTNWAIGQYISGTGIPANTRVMAVALPSLTLSKPTTISGSSVAISAVTAADSVDCLNVVVDGGGTDGATFTATFTNGSTSVTNVVVTSGTLANGQTLRGGVQAGAGITLPAATISAYGGGTTFTLSTPYTGTTGAVKAGTGSRTVPMVWFYGLAGGRISGTVQNVSYIGAQVSACDGTEFGTLLAKDVRGNGWGLGGNTADQLRACRFGDIVSRRVADGGAFSQPGNGMGFGGVRCEVARVIGRNNAGGHKFVPNCDAVEVGLSLFDGLVLPGEIDHGTSNSGTKTQGTDLSDQIGRMVFGQIVSRNCYGPGFFGRATESVSTGSYRGYKNGRGGVDGDIDVDTISSFEFDDMRIDRAGFHGIYLGDGMGKIGGRWVVHGFGQVQPTSCIGARLGGGYGTLDHLEVMDGNTGYGDTTNGSPILTNVYSNPGSGTATGLRTGEPITGTGIPAGTFVGSVAVGTIGLVDAGGVAVNATATAAGVAISSQLGVRALFVGSRTAGILTVKSYRCNAANCLDIRDNRLSLDNCVFLAAASPNTGQVTLTAAATTTAISNTNVRVQAVTGGYVEPLVRVTPLNASAQALVTPRSTFTSFTLTLRHAAAAGTEVFEYHIVGYRFRAAQSA